MPCQPDTHNTIFILYRNLSFLERVKCKAACLSCMPIKLFRRKRYSRRGDMSCHHNFCVYVCIFLFFEAKNAAKRAPKGTCHVTVKGGSMRYNLGREVGNLTAIPTIQSRMHTAVDVQRSQGSRPRGRCPGTWRTPFCPCIRLLICRDTLAAP